MRTIASHPTRGAWIEIGPRKQIGRRPGRRTPHGVRGLKSGLGRKDGGEGLASHPTRGAWIEIDRKGESL